MTKRGKRNFAIKRMSFGVREAEHIHEWAMALRQAQVECLMKDGGCFECLHIVERLVAERMAPHSKYFRHRITTTNSI